MKLNCKLRELCEAKGITQTQLSRDTGLAPSTVGKLYRNTVVRIDEKTILTLCKYFELKGIEELLQIEREAGD